MKNESQKKLDALQVWKDLEDLAVPRLKLTAHERAVYSHLLRHTRLVGEARVCCSITKLARGTGLASRATRKALQSMNGKGLVRMKWGRRAGHLIAVRLPEEMRAVREGKLEAMAAAEAKPAKENLEKADFMAAAARRQAIHAREDGRCFYCLQRTTPMTRCLDHVVPQARNGSNRYSNIVSACEECNGRKGVQRADDFLRWLYREGRLNTTDLTGRLRALEELRAGRMRPDMKGWSAPAKEGAK